MSRTLNLADHLLSRGQRLRNLGQTHDALHTLAQLSGLRELPAEIAEMTQASLAELCLERGKFRRARRHLTAALRHRPDCARYHHLLATALEADEKGDSERALRHYQRSLELDAEQPECLSDYGLLAVQLGRTEEGLTALKQAVEMNADEPELLQNLVTGLRLANRAGEARSALQAARFRHARDRRYEKLWNDFQFQELRRQQDAEKLRCGLPDDEEEGPVLLKFVRVERTQESPRGDGKIIRCDPPSSPTPPHKPPIRAHKKRKAQ